MDDAPLHTIVPLASEHHVHTCIYTCMHAYMHRFDLNDTVLHTIVPLASELAGQFDDFYDQGDWKVYDANIRFNEDAGALVFEIKVYRDASASVFKVCMCICTCICICMRMRM